MENDRVTKRVYVGERAGSRSVGRPRRGGLIPKEEVWMSGK